MGPSYATRADLYRYGFSRGHVANPGRHVASVDVSTNALILDGHGFETDFPISFRAEAGGSLPAPLVAGTVYYARRVSDGAFEVAVAAGGAALDITTAGQFVVVTADLPIDETLERYSRWVDGFCPGHRVPFTEPYPVEVVGLVAELSAVKLLNIQGQKSQSVLDTEAGAAKQLARYAKGVAMRDGDATASANLAIRSPVTADTRGWGTSGGTIP